MPRKEGVRLVFHNFICKLVGSETHRRSTFSGVSTHLVTLCVAWPFTILHTRAVSVEQKKAMMISCKARVTGRPLAWMMSTLPFGGVVFGGGSWDFAVEELASSGLSSAGSVQRRLGRRSSNDASFGRSASSRMAGVGIPLHG